MNLVGFSSIQGWWLRLGLSRWNQTYISKCFRHFRTCWPNCVELFWWAKVKWNSKRFGSCLTRLCLCRMVLDGNSSCYSLLNYFVPEILDYWLSFSFLNLSCYKVIHFYIVNCCIPHIHIPTIKSLMKQLTLNTYNALQYFLFYVILGF